MKNKIRICRTEKDMTLTDLSALTGLSVGYLCHLEKGSRNNPSYKVMAKISLALNKDISSIFL